MRSWFTKKVKVWILNKILSYNVLFVFLAPQAPYLQAIITIWVDPLTAWSIISKIMVQFKGSILIFLKAKIDQNKLFCYLFPFLCSTLGILSTMWWEVNKISTLYLVSSNRIYTGYFKKTSHLVSLLFLTNQVTDLHANFRKIQKLVQQNGGLNLRKITFKLHFSCSDIQTVPLIYIDSSHSGS